MKTITIKVQRVIQASPQEVYKGWLNPKVPGNPWHEGKKVMLNAKKDGLFYWYVSDTPHYGYFKNLKKGRSIQHTWMSPNTKGLETNVTVTFKKKGKDTLMTLVHKGLPDNPDGRGHEDGWGYFMDEAAKHLGKKKR